MGKLNTNGGLTKPRLGGFFRRFLKILFMTFGLFIMCLGTYSLSLAVKENIAINKIIDSFISRASKTPSLVREGFSGYEWRYYEVPREASYEIEDNRNVFYDEEKQELGHRGDVLLNRDSAFKNIPIIHQFVSYNFGGHVAVRDAEMGVYEATGMNASFSSFIGSIFAREIDGNNYLDTAAQHNEDYYFLYENEISQYAPFYRHEVMSMRYKGASDPFLDRVLDYLSYQVSHKSLYNYLFFLNMKNKHYCTALFPAPFNMPRIQVTKKVCHVLKR